ncbi:DUF5808 domain-containing protein [Hathewaya proteolytica]|nr:DUF5808 domain-containing protein [Hathewaya proteolytica]
MISFFTDRASNNGICFGIRLPKEYMDNKQIKSLKKKYRIIVSTVFVLVFITFNSIVFFGNYSSKELETEVISWMFMCFINYIIIKAKPDLNSGCIEKAVIRKKKFRRVNSIFIFVLTICMMILLSIKQLELLYNSNLLSLYNNLNILVAVITLIFLIQLIKIGQGGKHISSDEEDDELYKDDDDKWFLGEMYFNPKDPAWIVEKRIGIGWTVNFGNRKSWFIFFAIMTILVALKIIL